MHTIAINDHPTIVLNQKIIEALNTLIKLNIDSCKGWMTAAEHVTDPELRSRFLHFARVRDQAASDLQQLVRASGMVPPENGTIEGSMHRWWVNLKAKLNGPSLHSLLVDAERAEDEIKDEYEIVITESYSPVMNDMLTHQFAQVQKIHDEVRSLRDHAAQS